LEQKRKEAQKQYLTEQAYIKAHKADFERMLEEDRQAMAKEMAGTLWGALDTLTGGGPQKKIEEGKKQEPGRVGADAQPPTANSSATTPSTKGSTDGRG